MLVARYFRNRFLIWGRNLFCLRRRTWRWLWRQPAGCFGDRSRFRFRRRNSLGFGNRLAWSLLGLRSLDRRFTDHQRQRRFARFLVRDRWNDDLGGGCRSVNFRGRYGIVFRRCGLLFFLLFRCAGRFSVMGRTPAQQHSETHASKPYQDASFFSCSLVDCWSSLRTPIGFQRRTVIQNKSIKKRNTVNSRTVANTTTVS